MIAICFLASKNNISRATQDPQFVRPFPCHSPYLLSMESQSVPGGIAASQQRMNRVLGGAEMVIDETGEKMREEFLNFLETYL